MSDSTRAATSRPCREDDPTWPFPCNCDACCRAAAGQWSSLMDRVMDGDLSLTEAQTIENGSDSA